jgi:hypothetical protein
MSILTKTPQDDGRATAREVGVERQLLSAMFAPYLADEADAVLAARCINDAHTEMVGKRPDRLAAYAATRRRFARRTTSLPR